MITFFQLAILSDFQYLIFGFINFIKPFSFMTLFQGQNYSVLMELYCFKKWSDLNNLIRHYVFMASHLFLIKYFQILKSRC